MPLHSKNIGDEHSLNEQDCIKAAASHSGGKTDTATIDLNINPVVITDTSIPVTADAAKKKDDGFEENKKTMAVGSIAIKGS